MAEFSTGVSNWTGPLCGDSLGNASALIFLPDGSAQCPSGYVPLDVQACHAGFSIGDTLYSWNRDGSLQTPACHLFWPGQGCFEFEEILYYSNCTDRPLTRNLLRGVCKLVPTTATTTPAAIIPPSHLFVPGGRVQCPAGYVPLDIQECSAGLFIAGSPYTWNQNSSLQVPVCADGFPGHGCFEFEGFLYFSSCSHRPLSLHAHRGVCKKACSDNWTPGWAPPPNACLQWSQSADWGALQNGQLLSTACATDWAAAQCEFTCGCQKQTRQSPSAAAATCVGITVGSSEAVKKCVPKPSGLDGLVCAADAGNANKRTNQDVLGTDAFEITVGDSEVCARRTDFSGGWSMQLSFRCSLVFELVSCSGDPNSQAMTGGFIRVGVGNDTVINCAAQLTS